MANSNLALLCLIGLMVPGIAGVSLHIYVYIFICVS